MDSIDSKRDPDGCELDECVEVGPELVVVGADASEVLKLVDEAPDAVVAHAGTAPTKRRSRYARHRAPRRSKPPARCLLPRHEPKHHVCPWRRRPPPFWNVALGLQFCSLHPAVAGKRLQRVAESPSPTSQVGSRAAQETMATYEAKASAAGKMLSMAMTLTSRSSNGITPRTNVFARSLATSGVGWIYLQPP